MRIGETECSGYVGDCYTNCTLQTLDKSTPTKKSCASHSSILKPPCNQFLSKIIVYQASCAHIHNMGHMCSIYNHYYDSVIETDYSAGASFLLKNCIDGVSRVYSHVWLQLGSEHMYFLAVSSVPSAIYSFRLLGHTDLVCHATKTLDKLTRTKEELCQASQHHETSIQLVFK